MRVSICTLLFLCSLFPAVAIAADDFWGDLVGEQAEAVKQANDSRVTKVNQLKAADETNDSGDTGLIKARMKEIRGLSADVRKICSPVVQNLFKRDAGVSILKMNEETTRRITDALQSDIDRYVNDATKEPEKDFMEASLGEKQMQEFNNRKDKANSRLVSFVNEREDIMGKSAKMDTAGLRGAIANGGSDPFAGMSTLEHLWFAYAKAKILLDKKDNYADDKTSGALKDFNGGDKGGEYMARNVSPQQLAKAEMIGTSRLISDYYPGSTLSCINLGTGSLLSGLQHVTFENLIPITFEDVYPPFKLTWTVASINNGFATLVLQRDGEVHSQYNASIDFVKSAGAWVPKFRTVSIGTGIGRTQSEQTDDRKGNKQLTDDSETVKHLNWYYKAVYLPTVCKGDDCNVITFFRDLTNREFSTSVFATEKPVTKEKL